MGNWLFFFKWQVPGGEEYGDHWHSVSRFLLGGHHCFCIINANIHIVKKTIHVLVLLGK